MPSHSLVLASDLLGLEASTSQRLHLLLSHLSDHWLLSWFRLLLWPLAYVYLVAPRIGTSAFSIGGWGGADPWDICAELTSSPSSYWQRAETLPLCVDLIQRRFFSWLCVWSFLLSLWVLRQCILPGCYSLLCFLAQLLCSFFWSSSTFDTPHSPDTLHPPVSRHARRPSLVTVTPGPVFQLIPSRRLISSPSSSPSSSCLVLTPDLSLGEPTQVTSTLKKKSRHRIKLLPG